MVETGLGWGEETYAVVKSLGRRVGVREGMDTESVRMGKCAKTGSRCGATEYSRQQENEKEDKNPGRRRKHTGSINNAEIKRKKLWLGCV